MVWMWNPEAQPYEIQTNGTPTLLNDLFEIVNYFD